MDVTDVTGRFGPWQRRILLVILYRAIPLPFVLLNVQFFYKNIDHWCARDEQLINVTVEEWRSFYIPPNSHCEKYVFDDEGMKTGTVKCDSWEFDNSSDYRSNFKHEWSLVCHRSWLIAFSYTSMTVGNFMAYIPSGYIADRYGRRFTCLLGMVSLVVFGVIEYFSPNIEYFLTTRFFVGLAYGFLQTTSVCLFVEWVGPEYRSLMSMSFMGTFSLGKILLAGVAYFVDDWRTLHLVTFIPLCLISPILIWKFVPEPPRWLLTVGRYDEAEKVICEAAKMNGIEILDKKRIMKSLQEKIESEKITQIARGKATCFDLFRTRTIRKLTILLWITVTFNLFVSTGFMFNLTNLLGSLYMNYMILGFSSLLATGVCVLVTKYVSRRRSLLVAHLISGLCFFVSLAIPEKIAPFRSTVAIVGKISIEIAYTTWWLFSSEIFPTNLRGVGISGGMTMGRLGMLISTFTGEMGRLAGRNTPLIVFGVLSFLNSLLFLLLPETRDLHLPDTIKESERLPDLAEKHHPVDSIKSNGVLTKLSEESVM